MTIPLTRRQAARGAAALLAGPLAPPARAADPVAALTLVRRSLEVNGKPASVFGIHAADGRPGLALAPGQRFAVDLRNRAGGKTIIHWHGQTPPVRQDGVTETGLESLIGPGADRGYDYAPRPGTYWMHSHHGLALQQLMAAPLIVRTADDLRRDEQEIVVMLQDFSFRDPREILAGLTGGGGGGMAGMTMPGMTMPMENNAAANKAAAPGGTDLNDIDFDAYLANDRTLRDPEILRVAPGGAVRLRLINAAAATAFWIDIGALAAHAIAADGDPAHPLSVRRFPLSEGQRIDVRLRLPRGGGAFPILATREGDRRRTGIVLATPGARIARLGEAAPAPAGAADLSLERRLRAAAPLPPRRPDRVLRVALTGTMRGFRWGIDGRTWENRQPLMVAHGERVELDMVNRTMMAHPMHLHGHRFQVVALNATIQSGAMRDTVLVPPMGRVRVAFDADNPGRWLFHCHNLYHMAAGMMTEVAYAGFRDGV